MRGTVLFKTWTLGFPLRLYLIMHSNVLLQHAIFVLRTTSGRTMISLDFEKSSMRKDLRTILDGRNPESIRNFKVGTWRIYVG